MARRGVTPDSAAEAELRCAADAVQNARQRAVLLAKASALIGG